MNWISLIADLVVVFWTIPAVVRSLAHTFAWGLTEGADRVLRLLFWELRPFYLPAVIAHAGAGIILGDFDGWAIFSFACGLWNWWAFKDPEDDDDDRWKRRKEKLTEKVSILGGRLVVAPVGAR